MLSAQDVREISTKGPYTEPFSNAYAALNPDRLEREKWAWVAALMKLVCPADEDEDDLPGLEEDDEEDDDDDSPRPAFRIPDSEYAVAKRALGKPSEKPNGPSPFEIHPPIPKCETQSHLDVTKMYQRLSSYVSQCCICMIIFCDGQLVDARAEPHPIAIPAAVCC